MTAKVHYSYGGGSVGCLYDFGPEFAESVEDAIASLTQVYDLTDAEQATLRAEGILVFSNEPGSAIDSDSATDLYSSSRRLEVGADYCEINVHSGPMPAIED